MKYFYFVSWSTVQCVGHMAICSPIKVVSSKSFDLFYSKLQVECKVSYPAIDVSKLVITSMSLLHEEEA